MICLPGAKIEDVAERVGKVMDCGKGEAVLVHIGPNNAEVQKVGPYITSSGWQGSGV